MQLDLMDFSRLPTKEVVKRKRNRLAFAVEQAPQQLIFDLFKFLDELEDVDWTDKRIFELMDGMIFGALQSIRDKKFNSSGFAQEIAWFFDLDDESAFSAKNCATVAGFDIDELRLNVSRVLPEDKKEIIRLIDSGLYKS